MGYGDRMTEQEFRALRARVDGIYRQAYREIDEKAKEFARRHAVREAKYRQQVQNGKLSQQDFDAWMRGQVFQGRQWQAQRQQMADTLYHADEVAQAMANEGRFDVFAANANYMGYQMEMATGLNTSFTLYDANTVRRLAMDSPDLLPPKKLVGKDKAYQWYNRQIENVITQGIVQGESISEIAHRMAKTTGETNRAAMLRNARTMYTGAENAGRVEGMRQAEELGIKVRKKWRALLDKRTRESHRQLDSQIADVDKPFQSILGPIRYPGDPAADPANVWNCHCTLVSVYPDYPGSAKRRDNETGEIIGDVSYEEWEQGKREPEPAIDYLGATAAAFTAEQAAKAAQIVANATGPVKDVWMQQVGDLRAPVLDTNPGEAYYNPQDREVHYNAESVAKGSTIQAPFQTHFHEYFHNIDNRLGQRAHKGKRYTFLSNVYVDPQTGKTFDQMLQQESGKAIRAFYKKAAVGSWFEKKNYSDMMKNQSFAKSLLAAFVSDVKNRYSLLERGNISDIFENFFVTHHGGEYPFGAGHGAKYAKTPGARAREAFAEMGDATMANPGALKAILEFFPESYRIFEDMLRSVLQ